MYRSFKKAFCSFLALVLLIGLLPSQVFAIPGEASSQNEENGSLSLSEVVPDQSDQYALLDSGAVSLLGEDQGLREAASKQFRLSNGRMLAISYPFDVHYEEDGKLKDIDNSLYEDLENDALCNIDNSFTVSFPKTIDHEHPVTFFNKGYGMSFVLEDIRMEVHSITR